MQDLDKTEISFYPALVYAKNGKIWGINALKGYGLKQAQLSNEQNAFTICRTNSRNPGEFLGAGYEYTLPGENGICESEYGDNDDITKFVTLNMTEDSEPILSNLYHLTSIAYFTELEALGELFHEEDQLVWYENFRDPNTRLVIASGLSTISVASYTQNNSVYLILDNELKLFSASSVSLSETLFVFQPNSYSRVIVDSDYETLTIFNGHDIYRMDVNAEQPPLQIYTPDIQISGIKHISTTREAIQFAIVTDFEYIYYSMAKDGSNLIEWYRESTGDSIQGRQLSDGLHYFYDLDNLSVTFVRIDGQYQRTLNNSFILSYLYSYDFQSSKNDIPNIYEMLLIATFMGDGTMTLTTFGLDGYPIANVGRFYTSASTPFLGIPTVSNNKMIITLPSSSGEDVFFADLNVEGSLTQVTNDPIKELLINRYIAHIHNPA